MSRPRIWISLTIAASTLAVLAFMQINQPAHQLTPMGFANDAAIGHGEE